jgi:hypothetical protein
MSTDDIELGNRTYLHIHQDHFELEKRLYEGELKDLAFYLAEPDLANFKNAIAHWDMRNNYFIIKNVGGKGYKFKDLDLAMECYHLFGRYQDWFEKIGGSLAHGQTIPDKKSFISRHKKKIFLSLAALIGGSAIAGITAHSLLDIDFDGLTGLKEKKYGTDPFNPDTDKDGILDGVEVKPDPAIFGKNPKNWPNPLKMDIYVEIDWLALYEPMPKEAKDMVVEFFANAPVLNPDGSTGIRLHIDDGTPGYDFGVKNGGEAVDRVVREWVTSDKKLNDILYENYFPDQRKSIFHYCTPMPVVYSLLGECAGWAKVDRFALSYRYFGMYKEVIGWIIEDGASSDEIAHLWELYNIRWAELFTHELGHLILDTLDLESQGVNRGHSKYGDIMKGEEQGMGWYKGFHPNLWKEVQRDGVVSLRKLNIPIEKIKYFLMESLCRIIKVLRR